MLTKDSDQLVESESTIANPEPFWHKFARQASLAQVGFLVEAGRAAGTVRILDGAS